MKLSKSTVIAFAATSIIFTGAASANEEKERALTGFGSGVVAGGAIAGPIGALVGGMIGTVVGEQINQAEEKEQLIADLSIKEQELIAQNRELKELQKKYQHTLLAFQDLQHSASNVVQVSQITGDTSFSDKPFEAFIQFRTASKELEPHYLQSLRQIASMVKSNPELQIQLFGYADRRGDEKYNQALSEKRAQSVKAELVKLGVDVAQIEAGGYGEAQPVAYTQDTESDFFDRRVVLRMSANNAVMTASQD